MKLLVISDLHIDSWGTSLASRHARFDRSLNFDPILRPLAVSPTAPRSQLVLPPAHVLVVAGDILNGTRPNLLSRFLKAARQHYPTVVTILGNHEYHSSLDMTATEEAFRKVCNIPGVIPLVSETVYLPDPDQVGRQVAFHGTTLWAALEPFPVDPVPDFYKIKVKNTDGSLRSWTAAESQALFHNTLTWLDQAIATAAERGIDSVVVSHHAPLAEGTFSPRYAKSGTLSSYVSDLRTFIKSKSKTGVAAGLTTWLFGHTHHYTDLMESGVRVYSNPLGYHDETEIGYRAGEVIEV